MLLFAYMKPLLFIAFLGLGPAIGSQTPSVAPGATVHVVVGDVEQLPDADAVGVSSLRGHDAMAQNAKSEGGEVQR